MAIENETNKPTITQQVLSIVPLYLIMIIKVLVVIPTSIIMLCNSVIEKATNNENSK